MKIKIAFLDTNDTYLKRLTSVMLSKYPEKLQIYSFTNIDDAFESINTSKIEVLLADTEFNIDVKKLPPKTSFAYFVDDNTISTYKNEKAVAKFQKSESLYKQILSLYAEKAESITGLKSEDQSSCKLITFVSASGGVGSSTASAAFSFFATKNQKKVIYINIEQFGTTEKFFSGQGQEDFSDVLYAIKSSSNLELKLESAVQEDISGVHFIKSPKVALDINELDENDLVSLIEKLKVEAKYDYIVFDSDFCINKKMITLIKLSEKLVFVDDGSEISNNKLSRALTAIKTLEEQNATALLKNCYILYNKFSNKSSKTLEGTDLKNLGGAPLFEHATTKQVIEQLTKMSIFNDLL